MQAQALLSQNGSACDGDGSGALAIAASMPKSSRSVLMDGPEGTGPIPVQAWQMIERRGVDVTFGAGETLLQHGALGRTWFAIVSGTALVTATSTQGATLVLGKRSSGDLLGELAALEGAPRAATATAKDKVVAIKLQREDLDAILRENPEWALMLLQQLAGQLRSMSYRYTLRSEDLRRRLEALLATHVEETGEMTFRSTREELASWVGATREATARMLQKMQADGIVRLSRGSVEIVDLDRLMS
jgi:CRP/FNR family cyclic AMP-dependent transcriptional regulator